MIEYVEDSLPVLEQGTGTPYLAIFSEGGRPIMDDLSGLPLGTFVTQFEYTYEEEKEDHGKIQVEINNPNIVDLPELQYWRGLQLQWGYIYSSRDPYCGPLRRVIIVDTDIRFTQEGVRMTIEFKDASILLKTQASNYRHSNQGFAQWLDDTLSGVQQGVTIIDYNAKEKAYPVVFEREKGKSPLDYTPDDEEWDKGGSTTLYHYDDKRNPRHQDESTGKVKRDDLIWYIPQAPPTVLDETNPTVAVKILNYSPYLGEGNRLITQFPNDYRMGYMKELQVTTMAIIGTAKNKWNQLKDLASTLPNGPYFMDARDGVLTIHNQRVNRPSQKIYTWAGGNGELLTFQVKSKYIRSVVEVTQKQDIDPDTKSLDIETSQIFPIPEEGASENNRWMYWPRKDRSPNSSLWKTVSTSAVTLGTLGSGVSFGGSLLLGGIAWGLSEGIDAIGEGIASNKDYEYLSYIDPKQAAASRKGQRLLKKGKVKANTKEEASFKGPVYGSVQEAQRSEAQSYMITKEDIDSYMESLKHKYEVLKNANTPEGYKEALSTLQALENYTVKRTVVIEKRVNPYNFSGKEFRNSEEFRNRLDTLNSEDIDKIPVDKSKFLRNRWYAGIEHLRNAGVLVESSLQPSSLGSSTGPLYNRTVTIRYEQEIEIPISGIRILSEAPSDLLVDQVFNDMMETIRNTLTAKATLIGDPVLESSMNLVIRNVSAMYSGAWYIKKVSHKIDFSNGYICDIDFTKKTTTVTANQIISKADTSKIMANLQKKVAELGPNAVPVQEGIKNKMLELQKADPNSSYAALVGENGKFDIVKFPAVSASKPDGVSRASYWNETKKTWERISDAHIQSQLKQLIQNPQQKK